MHQTAAMVRFVVEYGKDSEPPSPDGRLDAPTFHRNHEPIWSAIAGFLENQTGDVLELGSGTGQHAATFARRTPGLVWWPSDIHASHLKSITAWQQHDTLANLRSPQRIDLSEPNWNWQGNEGPDKLLTAIIAINVLHISPWRVSQNLFSGAGRLLGADGRLFLYGPFMREGKHTAPSNAAFDEALRTNNPEWGVRDVGELDVLATKAGLSLARITEMPANNLVLAFGRTLRQN